MASGKYNFFPSTLIEWNNSGLKIQNSESIAVIEKYILVFIRPSLNIMFNCCFLKGLRQRKSTSRELHKKYFTLPIYKQKISI